MYVREKVRLQGAGLILALALTGATLAAPADKPGKPVDWPAINSAFQGASFVNDTQTCLACHEDAMKAFDHTKHAKAFSQTAPAGGQCGSCHGPRSKHVESPTAELAWKDLTAAQQSSVCLQCHEGGTRFAWKVGAHTANDVSCTACHAVMSNKSPRGLLAGGAPGNIQGFSQALVNRRTGPPGISEQAQVMSETCFQCHSEVRGEMGRMSHHPVREGRMDCASCHNVHGGTPGLLIKNTVNDTCVSCHAEKRGPFVWEHAPVREDCANCHTPHGANNRNLLANKDSFLCLSCHSYGGHINLPRYNRVSNPYGRGCMNCHTAVHGSNHPSGAKLTR
jgi:predicted CXXCH cytochrome family protein